MRSHFQDLHPWDKVVVPKELRSYPRCCYCQMQVNPVVTGHWKKEESCLIRMDRKEGAVQCSGNFGTRPPLHLHGHGNNMGTHQTGVARGECISTRHCQDLQGVVQSVLLYENKT
jgi:hypothetical protein